MVSHISYNFTLFKKFQVINHVPSKTYHGDPTNPQNNFDLKVPAGPFGTSLRGKALVPLNFIPAQNPLWVILNEHFVNNTPGGTPIAVPGSGSWPVMPYGSPPGWLEFQVGPANNSTPTLIDVFGTWISTDQQLNDIPAGVIAQQPAPFPGGLEPGIKPFVCSTAGDQGTRPVSLPNFWATSLIYLVDPANGNTIAPPNLAPGNEHYVVAVIGNRGNTNGGRYLNQPAALQAAAVVMIFGTTVSPGVRLPALSNLDITDINPINETYFLRSGEYDVIGFRLNVQTVFDGLVAAVNQAVNVDQTLNIGTATPEDWVRTPPSHLCVKVVTRVQGDQFPAIDTSPENDARIAQKNLVPFDVSINVNSTTPHIDWTTFIAGQPLALVINGAGKNELTLLTKLPRDLFEIFVAMPEKVHEQFVLRTKAGITGFKQVNAKEILGCEHGNKPLPFARDAVILQAVGEKNSFEFGPMPDGHAAGMALGFRYIPSKLKHGTTGDVTMVHEAMVPRLDRGSGCYKVEKKIVGGFTMQVRALDPHIDPKGRRIEFGDN